MPALPQVARMPDLPQVSRMPDLPQVARMPALPQASSMPDLPQTSRMTTLPHVASMPALPQASRMPARQAGIVPKPAAAPEMVPVVLAAAQRIVGPPTYEPRRTPRQPTDRIEDSLVGRQPLAPATAAQTADRWQRVIPETTIGTVTVRTATVRTATVRAVTVRAVTTNGRASRRRPPRTGSWPRQTTPAVSLEDTPRLDESVGAGVAIAPTPERAASRRPSPVPATAASWTVAVRVVRARDRRPVADCRVLVTPLDRAARLGSPHSDPRSARLPLADPAEFTGTTGIRRASGLQPGAYRIEVRPPAGIALESAARTVDLVLPSTTLEFRLRESL